MFVKMVFLIDEKKIVKLICLNFYNSRDCQQHGAMHRVLFPWFTPLSPLSPGELLRPKEALIRPAGL